MNRKIVIAHKGASAYAPENTLRSFEKAWELGADMIELDLRETADGHLVCIHDPTVDRTTDGVGNVSSLSLKELQMLDAGSGEQIPLLEDVLKFARGKIQVNIDLKILGAESRIIEMVSQLNMNNDVFVSSFLHLTLLQIKEIDESFRVAVLVNTEIDELATYSKELGAFAINPSKELTTYALVQDAHERELKVFPWTVNDEELMMNLLDVGVDGLITDFPDVGIKVTNSRSMK
ncbi:MAG: glycerophosphodiester phosphodiesterase [Candidatus Thorarchaeota archaeon]